MEKLKRLKIQPFFKFCIVKEPANERQALSEKVFCYLWGVAKNYIMYWGVTSVIIYETDKKCSQKIAQLYPEFVHFYRKAILCKLFSFFFCAHCLIIISFQGILHNKTFCFLRRSEGLLCHFNNFLIFTFVY